jgi:hypothetical protein
LKALAIEDPKQSGSETRFIIDDHDPLLRLHRHSFLVRHHFHHGNDQSAFLGRLMLVA